MSGGPIDFLRSLAGDAELLDSLKTRSKDEVLKVAAERGFTFTEGEFDSSVWDAEVRLAKWRDEPFDAQFPLWRTMWGRPYLEYLVTDLISSIDETAISI